MARSKERFVKTFRAESEAANRILSGAHLILHMVRMGDIKAVEPFTMPWTTGSFNKFVDSWVDTSRVVL